MLVPIITDRKGVGIGTYTMPDEEIKRFNSPPMREQQKNEMYEEVELKRRKKLLEAVKKRVEKEQTQSTPDSSFIKQLKQILPR